MTEEFSVMRDETISKLKRIVQNLPSEITDGKHPTTISGRAKWQTCWLRACYLSKYIYKFPPPLEGFQTQYEEKMDLIEEHWDMWDERVEQEKSGFVARLYKLKSYDPSVKSDFCPPTLVFRGTDFEDMRDIALCASIHLHMANSKRDYTFIYRLDNKIDPQKTREQLIDSGFVSVPIYSQREASIPLVPTLQFGNIALDVTLTLEFLLKEDGDWLNNIQQGLGKESKQYEQAINYGRRLIDTKVKYSTDKRLEITGHSLGGGLASAVCSVLDRQYPDIFFHAIVFNPAGVHPNTIYPATVADGLVILPQNHSN